MTTRPRRSTRKDINYSTFNNTGRVVEKTNSTLTDLNISSNYQTIMEEQTPTKQELLHHVNTTAIITDVLTGLEEITDMMNEHNISSSSVTDNNETIESLITLRRDIRHHMNQLKVLDPEIHDVHFKTYDSTIKKVGEFIINCKDRKTIHQVQAEKALDNQSKLQEKSQQFIVNDIIILLNRLEGIYNQDLDKMTDTELIQLKSQLSDHDKSMRTIAEKYQELLKTPSVNIELESQISDIGQKYIELSEHKGTFIDHLNEQFTDREIEKYKSFKESNLNIKIEKFSGYESIDIYTFRSNFEKIHLRNTPKKLLPDLLINNHLSEPALSLVKGLTDIDIIWDRLIKAYGNSKMLVSRKLADIKKLDPIKTRHDPAKILRTITGLIKVLRDLISLANQHQIENQLYYGDCLDQVYQLLDDTRLDKWLATICEEEITEKDKWLKLIIFLEKDVKLLQHKQLIKPSTYTDEKDGKQRPPKQKYGSHHVPSPSPPLQQNPVCHFCDGKCNSAHVQTRGPFGKMVTQYYACKDFADKTPKERYATLKRKGLCYQCLLPGAKSSEGKHKDGRCQYEFVCKHPSHQSWIIKKHVLVCEDHKDSNDNQTLLETYKNRYIIRNQNLPTFSKEIRVSFHTECHLNAMSSNNSSSAGIYLLQQILVNNQTFTVFFDNGCSDFVVRKSAVDRLGSYATQVFSGDVNIGGVGGTSTQSSHGIYLVNLPLHDGKMVPMKGICLDQITQTFPLYPLASATSDLHKAYATTGDVSKLPSLPQSIGGDVDIMIGVRYLNIHPKLIFQTRYGLSLFESAFNGPSGRGVLAGPHSSFDEINKAYYDTLFNIRLPLVSYFASLSFIGHSNNKFDISPEVQSHHMFDIAEKTGSEILYRCVNCRNCKDCKSHGATENISIREEVEQHLIAKSICINRESNIITAKLPFIHDPEVKLAPNQDKAMKIYQQQLRKLNRKENLNDKEDVIQSEKKLQNLGFVDYVRNLPQHIQQMLQTQLHHFIPWRAVWKPGSVSTPCRIVFDASSPTSTGFSLNDIIAKGRNNMNLLQEIAIRFLVHRAAFTTDVSKMYNTVKLEPEHWCYQRYMWQEDLNPQNIPEEKVIKTLIYGVRSAGNQSEFALREIARLSQDSFPEASNIILNDTYVDDCISGEDSIELVRQRSGELESVVNKGGFKLKGIVISGEDPPETMSEDKESVTVAGMRWFPKQDLISLNIGELNFAPKKRGKKASSSTNIIPDKLTRRHCASKVGEVFDLLGKVTPITAQFKLDLHELVIRKFDWDDIIPDELREVWINNFELMQEINQLKFQRAIIPEDAVSLKLDTLDFADASQSLVCVAIYARFKRRNGSYSSQLILSRSRLVPQGMSQPRAELYAALLNSHTGEVVRKSLQKWHQSSIKLSDSQIVLHWLNNDKKTLKQWVRCRVIECLRFTISDQWHYVHSDQMIADIGTRRGPTLNDINDNSRWINGDPWMHLEISEMPITKISDVEMSKSEETQAAIETYHSEVHHSSQSDPLSKIMDEVLERLKFSNYLISPLKYRFQKVVRIMAIIIKFIGILKQQRKTGILQTWSSKAIPSMVFLTEEDITTAKNYFFKKGTQEVKKFIQSKRIKDITSEVDGILKYTGRILDTNDIKITGRFTNSMRDLSSSTFCVPILDKFSPLAIAIINEVHWYHHTAKHSGVETTLRFVHLEAYIIEGRSLVKLVRKSCQRCRYLMKRAVDVAMGPVSKHNLTIAPAFYASQVDLCGPFDSYSPHHKRTTVKVWLLVFCCATTSTTNIKLMDDYSTQSFILGFTRFSCEVGYPKTLLCDAGSQLIKGCQDMRLSYLDIKHQLFTNHQIDFEVCSVGAHNEHGKVERKIREITSSINIAHQRRLSILQWETLVSSIANSINNMPLAIKGIVGDLENLDILTPNRLKLGRNNERSPVEPVQLISNPSKLIDENKKIFDSWFENWLLSHVPKLMRQDKWFTTSDEIKIGDIVLFLKNDSKISSTYQYGKVVTIEFSSDGLARHAIVKYMNASEKVFRETRRSTRNLVIISHVDEIDLFYELGKNSLKNISKIK